MNNPETKGQPLSEAVPVHKRNPRASVQEMKKREHEALELLNSVPEVDVYLVAEELGITVPQATTVIFNLAKQGKIQRSGIRARRAVFARVEKQTPHTEDHGPEPEPQPAVKLPLHLGQELEVTEIRWTGAGIQAQLKAKDDEEMYVLALVS